jgi:peptidyl-prolyl cis-trans isomerase C
MQFNQRKDGFMNSFSRTLMVTVMILTACVLAFAQDEPNAPAAELAKEKPADIVVTVNGQTITETQINERLDKELKPMAKQMAPNYLEQYKARMRPQMIDFLVTEMLLDTKVDEAGIKVTDQDADKKIKDLAAENKITVKGLRQQIEDQGRDFEYWRQQIKKPLAYEKLMETKWEGHVTVTEEDAQEYYRNNKKQFSTPERVHAKHILIKVDQGAADEEKTNAKQRLDAIREEIKNGADFSEMAKNHSDCPSAKNGGDLGYFAKGQMVKPFEEAAFAAEPGTMTDVVETQFGYHLIKVEDHSPGSQAEYEEAKLDILQMLLKQKQQQFMQEYVEKLKSEADIVYAPGKEPKAAAPASAGSPQVTVRPKPAQESSSEED